MLPPILPRPIRPSCMCEAFPSCAGWAPCPRSRPGGIPAAGSRVAQATPGAPGPRSEGWSAGEPDGHEHVAVGGVGLAVELVLAREHRRPRRLGERQPAERRAHGTEAVE